MPEPQEEEDLGVEGVEAQVDDDTDHTHSVATIVCNDHDRIKGLWRRYKDPTDSAHERQLLVMQLLRELTVHMGAEEAVLYPVVAERVEEHMAEHALDEHESLKLFASDLEAMVAAAEAAAEGGKAAAEGPGGEGFEAKLHQLMETLLDHTYEEEHRMLPALRDALDERELCELGSQFEAAKRHLPTRPHPTDPSRHVDDAVVLADAARDAAAFEGTPPAIGTDSTQVLRRDGGSEAAAA